MEREGKGKERKEKRSWEGENDRMTVENDSRGRVSTGARRLISCTTSLAGPGSNPGAGTVNQTAHTVHPSGVGKLVAFSRQLGDHCRILQSVKRDDRKMTGVNTAAG